MVSLVARPGELARNGQSHGKEDRYAGALAGGGSVVLQQAVGPRSTRSAWI